MGENTSEVAHIRQQIELEYAAAMRGLQGYAHTARHEFIETRMNNMSAYHQKLIHLVGEKEAIKMIVELIEQGGHNEQPSL